MLWVKNNADKIYAFLGENEYKKHNIEKAQSYFEKSFVLGNHDIRQRNNYVDSLINSPLTISSQEKLICIAEDKIQDSASMKAQQFLYDLMRKIHKQYPYNYIQQAPFNRKILRWSNFPITYTFKNAQDVPESMYQEIENAFQEWEKYGAVKFAKIGAENANIAIEFKQNQTENTEYGQKYIIAFTTPTINQNSLDKMTIVFYPKDSEGNYFTPNQIYSTALHEIMHALGFMGHSYDKNNIMYLAKDNESLINDTRKVLTDADITTLNLLYKIKPDITNASLSQGEYLPYLLLGDEGDINFSKAKEAKNYINQAPTLPAGYIDLAENYVAEENFSAAIKCLEKALILSDSNDTNYIIYYNLAVSYFYINHLDMALSYIQKAEEITDSEDLHCLKAEIYSKQKETLKAENEYNYLLNKSPNNINYVINLTNIYIKNYNYLKARHVLKSFLKNNPQEKDNTCLKVYGLLKF